MFLLAQWFFGGLGHQGRKTKHVPEHRGFVALPPKAARPNNHDFQENVWLFGLGAPGLQKNTWPQKHFGIPLDTIVGLRVVPILVIVVAKLEGHPFWAFWLGRFGRFGSILVILVWPFWAPCWANFGHFGMIFGRVGPILVAKLEGPKARAVWGADLGPSTLQLYNQNRPNM